MVEVEGLRECFGSHMALGWCLLPDGTQGDL